MASSKFSGSLFEEVFIIPNGGDKLRARTEACDYQNTANSDWCNCSIHTFFCNKQLFFIVLDSIKIMLKNLNTNRPN